METGFYIYLRLSYFRIDEKEDSKTEMITTTCQSPSSSMELNKFFPNKKDRDRVAIRIKVCYDCDTRHTQGGCPLLQPVCIVSDKNEEQTNTSSETFFKQETPVERTGNTPNIKRDSAGMSPYKTDYNSGLANYDTDILPVQTQLKVEHEVIDIDPPCEQDMGVSFLCQPTHSTEMSEQMMNNSNMSYYSDHIVKPNMCNSLHQQKCDTKLDLQQQRTEDPSCQRMLCDSRKQDFGDRFPSNLPNQHFQNTMPQIQNSMRNSVLTNYQCNKSEMGDGPNINASMCNSVQMYDPSGLSDNAATFPDSTVMSILDGPQNPMNDLTFSNMMDPMETQGPYYAELSLPDMLKLEVRNSEHGKSVVTKYKINKYTQFGPLIGPRIRESDIPEDFKMVHLWEVSISCLSHFSLDF